MLFSFCFLFMPKTAYEVRISDWSSDVCSSDLTADSLRPFQRVDGVLDRQHRWRVDGLPGKQPLDQLAALGHAEQLRQRPGGGIALQPGDGARAERQHATPGRASDRERGGKSGATEDVEGTYTKKNIK